MRTARFLSTAFISNKHAALTADESLYFVETQAVTLCKKPEARYQRAILRYSRSRDSSVGIVTSYWLGSRNFSFYQASRQALGSTLPPTQRGPQVKGPRYAADLIRCRDTPTLAFTAFTETTYLKVRGLSGKYPAILNISKNRSRGLAVIRQPVRGDLTALP